MHLSCQFISNYRVIFSNLGSILMMLFISAFQLSHLIRPEDFLSIFVNFMQN